VSTPRYVSSKPTYEEDTKRLVPRTVGRKGGLPRRGNPVKNGLTPLKTNKISQHNNNSNDDRWRCRRSDTSAANLTVQTDETGGLGQGQLSQEGSSKLIRLVYIIILVIIIGGGVNAPIRLQQTHLHN